MHGPAFDSYVLLRNFRISYFHCHNILHLCMCFIHVSLLAIFWGSLLVKENDYYILDYFFTLKMLIPS